MEEKRIQICIAGEMYEKIPLRQDAVKTIEAEYCASSNKYFPDQNTKIAHQIKSLLILNGITQIEAVKSANILSNVDTLRYLLNPSSIILYVDDFGNKYLSLNDLNKGPQFRVNYENTI